MKKALPLLLIATLLASEAHAALTDNLIAYWKLDETSDGSGAVTREDSHAANDLTDNNTTPSVSMIINNGVDVEFSNDEFLSITDNTDLSLGADTDFSVSFWFSAESLPGAGTTRTLISKSPASSGTTVEWWVGSVDGDKFRFRVANGASSVTHTRSFTPTLDQIYFVVVWHDSAANVVGMSVDGDTATTSAWSGGTQDGAGAFCIGTLNLATAGNWDGKVDEVGFWKRVLTSDERTSLYNSGAGLSYDDFDGGAASAIKTWNGLADASVKTSNGLARASVKTKNGLA